jgi:hypothetical protein
MMLTIVWDVDDVLNDLMTQWFHLGWKAEHPECTLSFDDLRHNPPDKVLGIEREEYLVSMDRFRVTEKGLNLSPNPEILAWFIEQGQQFRHIALTARPLETAPDVAAWVMRHFGAWIRCFGVVPSRASGNQPIYDRSKIDFLKWLQCGDVLVDDADENVQDAELLGMRTFQIAQPWNKSTLTTAALAGQLSDLAARN